MSDMHIGTGRFVLTGMYKSASYKILIIWFGIAIEMTLVSGNFFHEVNHWLESTVVEVILFDYVIVRIGHLIALFFL